MKIRTQNINLVIVFCALTSFLLACGEKEHPKDEQLIQNFQAHKAEFNQLVQIFREDKSLGRVAFDFTRPSNFFEKCKAENAWNGKEIEINENRLKEYRKLFRILGLSKGIEGYCEKDVIWFYVSSRGLSITGSSKGYAYIQENPGIIVDDLDNYWSENGKSFVAFRHVEGNWYLYLDYED